MIAWAKDTFDFLLFLAVAYLIVFKLSSCAHEESRLSCIGASPDVVTAKLCGNE